MAPETAAETETPLTLSNAIEIALANNPELLQAVARMAQARAMQSLADAAFWPAVGAYTEYMQGDAPSAYLFKTIDQRQLPQNLNFNDPGWFENFETGVSARMNLFNGAGIFSPVPWPTRTGPFLKLDRQSIVNELTSQVIAAFYDVLSAREFADIAETSVATVSEQLRIAKVRFEEAEH
ncbi:MAG: TolC family protein [Desulfobacterales bacterium]